MVTNSEASATKEQDAASDDASEGTSMEPNTEPLRADAEEAAEPVSTETPSLPPSAADADAAIGLAVREGDLRKAIAIAATTHGRAIGRLCQALVGGAGDVDDLVQETLLAAHGALPAFRGECSLRGFLLGIARRKCAAHLAKRGRREVTAASDEVAPGADELLLDRERARRARTLLDTLKPGEREALVLRYVGELSFRDVGAALNIDETAARKRVSRAIAELRSRTEGERS